MFIIGGIGKGIKEIQQAQRDAIKIVVESQPEGYFGRLIKDTTLYALRYLQSVTRVDTGALRSSHIPEIRKTKHGIEGRIFIGRGRRNPKHGQFTYKYGVILEDRGRHFAAYRRTFDHLRKEEHDAQIVKRLIRRYHNV